MKTILYFQCSENVCPIACYCELTNAPSFRKDETFELQILGKDKKAKVTKITSSEKKIIILCEVEISVINHLVTQQVYTYDIDKYELPEQKWK